MLNRKLGSARAYCICNGLLEVPVAYLVLLKVCVKQHGAWQGAWATMDAAVARIGAGLIHQAGGAVVLTNPSAHALQLNNQRTTVRHERACKRRLKRLDPCCRLLSLFPERPQKYKKANPA